MIAVWALPSGHAFHFACRRWPPDCFGSHCRAASKLLPRQRFHACMSLVLFWQLCNAVSRLRPARRFNVCVSCSTCVRARQHCWVGSLFAMHAAQWAYFLNRAARATTSCRQAVIVCMGLFVNTIAKSCVGCMPCLCCIVDGTNIASLFVRFLSRPQRSTPRLKMLSREWRPCLPPPTPPQDQC